MMVQEWSLSKRFGLPQSRKKDRLCCFSDVVKMMCVLGQWPITFTAFDFEHENSSTTSNFIAEQDKIINYNLPSIVNS